MYPVPTAGTGRLEYQLPVAGTGETMLKYTKVNKYSYFNELPLT